MAPLLLTTLLTGCATSINNKTVLENEESILMLCKSGPSFILTQQVQLPSKEAVIVKTLPVTADKNCTLIKEYDSEILLTNITSNRGNKDQSRVSVQEVELLSGNLMTDEKTGYKVKLSPNSINYIGHLRVDSSNAKRTEVSFVNNIDEAKRFLEEMGISKFSVVVNLPEENK